MRIPLPTPEPPQLGEQDGLAYALFLPGEEPIAGVVICHGAGSAKESHFDFGRAARGAGLAAVAPTCRNASKMCPRSAAAIPGPVSATSKRCIPCFTCTCKRIRPRCVYQSPESENFT